MKRIFLSAGHNLNDPGAVVPKTTESKEVIQTRNLIAQELENRGATFVLVPDSLSLKETIKWINDRANSGDVALEIHCNTSNGSRRGAEAFYDVNSQQRRKDAELILDKLGQEVPGLKIQGAKPDTMSFRQKLGFCRNIKIPSVLVELCFIDNPQDLDLLNKHRGKFAQGLANGLMEWSGQKLLQTTLLQGNWAVLLEILENAMGSFIFPLRQSCDPPRTALYIPVVGTTRQDVAEIDLKRKDSKGQEREHKGLDISAAVGTTVVSIASGTLVYAEKGHTIWKDDSDPGKPGFQQPHSVLVQLDKPITRNGKTARFAYYTHMTTLDPAIANRSGIKIEAGQVLGKVGFANSAHLHIGLVGDRDQKEFMTSKEVTDILYSGDALSLKDSGEVSEKLLHSAIRRNVTSILNVSNNPVTRLLMGHAYLATNNNNASLVSFFSTNNSPNLVEWSAWTERFLENNPQHPIALYLSADAKARTGYLEEAITKFTQALAVKPDFALALNGRGTVYALQKQWDSAYVDLYSTTKLDPDLADAYANLGTLAVIREFSLFQGSSALDAFNQALQINPNFTLAYNGRGCLHYGSGQFETAARDFEMAAIQFREAFPSPDITPLADAKGQKIQTKTTSTSSIKQTYEHIEAENILPPSLPDISTDYVHIPPDDGNNNSGGGVVAVPQFEKDTSSENSLSPLVEAMQKNQELAYHHKGQIIDHTPRHREFIPGGISTEELARVFVDKTNWPVKTFFGLLYEVSPVQNNP